MSRIKREELQKMKYKYSDVDNQVTDITKNSYKIIIDRIRETNLTNGNLAAITGLSSGPLREMERCAFGTRDEFNIRLFSFLKIAIVLGMDIPSLFIDDENRLDTLKKQIGNLHIDEKREIMGLLTDTPIENVSGSSARINGKYYSPKYFCDIYWENNVFAYDAAKLMLDTYISFDEKYAQMIEILNRKQNSIFYTAKDELLEIKYDINSAIIIVYYFDGVEADRQYMTATQFFDALICKYYSKKDRENE